MRSLVIVKIIFLTIGPTSYYQHGNTSLKTNELFTKTFTESFCGFLSAHTFHESIRSSSSVAITGVAAVLRLDADW